MQDSNPENLLRLREGGETFRDRVRNPLMFKAYMLGKMPVLGVSGSYLAHIGPRRAEMAVPYGWRTKNLFGRLFDSAVIAAAETTSLALLVLHIRNQSTDFSAEMLHLEVDVHRAVSEDVRIRCNNGRAYAEFVRDAYHSPKGDREARTASFEVIAQTEDGALTHELRFTWRLTEKG